MERNEQANQVEVQAQPAPLVRTCGAVQKPRQQPPNTGRANTGSGGANRRLRHPAHGQAKLRGYYGNITEKQFRNIFAEASRRAGDTSENLIGLLERRLDAVVYRMKFVPTVFAARQFVNHGHVKVNGKRVNIPSYRVSDGDIVEVKEKSRQLAIVLEASDLPERDVPDYIDVDHAKMRGTFVRTPQLSDVPYPVHMEPNLVIEYYSR